VLCVYVVAALLAGAGIAVACMLQLCSKDCWLKLRCRGWSTARSCGHRPDGWDEGQVGGSSEKGGEVHWLLVCTTNSL
jgi:hypothetical protein